MSQNLEIEFKNILTSKEYEVLLKAFQIKNHQIFVQKNHYFDTPNFDLKEQESALRVRQKNNGFEMTLKQPASIGLIETNQTINEQEAQDAIQCNKIPSGEIKQLLEANEINVHDIEYFGELLTRRVEFPFKDGLLVLDHSVYLNKEDFELEYEVKDYQKGKDVFSHFLNHFSIPQRKTENKIRRFYNQKYKEQE